MKCPGSVTLAAGLHEDESPHAKRGTAVHHLAAFCLQNGVEPWTQMGGVFDGQVIDDDDANAAQVYVSYIQETYGDRNQGNSWIERPFYCPEWHDLMYGTSDFTFYDAAEKVLHVVDYKNGAGIIVEPFENPQLMYYAVGMLTDLDLFHQAEWVNLVIVQPNGFHSKGPIRSWTTPVAELAAWAEDVLVPSMNWAMTSTDVVSGEHCRFCPARARACPAIIRDFEEAEELLMEMKTKGGAEELTDAQVSRFLNLFDVLKIAASAASKTAMARMSHGKEIPGYKLVKSRTNREWREGAVEAIVAKFGTDAYTAPSLKSPAQIDKLPEGEALTAEFAYKPDGGLTVAKVDDTRGAIDRNAASLFKPVKGKEG
jgi:hypothetical protein